ncbi:MAG: serine/threonine-protein kinase [Reyranella sp.]|nr:serine/threonine-protein kinase [Reyranella sp.]
MDEVAVSPDAARADVDLDALPIGQTIGRYTIVSILGQGAFGITYGARDDELGRDVAIKEYLPAALAMRRDGSTVRPRSTKAVEDFDWGRDRFIAEGRTLATLHRAPAIVRVFDFLHANGTTYMVMELLHGETLENRLSRTGALDAAALAKVLWPLLDGLEQVHNAGFLHRDIKPGNILLDGDGNPTLIDFGAARAAIAGRTAVMTAVFTPGYAAAEQFTSAREGPWTDIYGLSATLYHAIAGRAPPNAFERLQHDAFEPLARLRPAGLPSEMLAGIDAGLQVDASERPQSIARWRSAFVERRFVPTLAPAQDLPAPAGRRASMRWLVLVAVAAVIVAGGGYLGWRGSLVPDASTGRSAADEAARRQAEEQANADVARRKAEEDERKAAEAAEAAMRLAVPDRQRLQVALISLGFNTGSTDGMFGPRSREMIASWQKKQGKAATGFLNADQRQALLREAAVAVGRYDEEQKKLEDEKKKANEGKVQAVAVPSPVSVPAELDGMWVGKYECASGAHAGNEVLPAFALDIRLKVAGGKGTWQNIGATTPMALRYKGMTHSIGVKVDGTEAIFTRAGRGDISTPPFVYALAGQFDGSRIWASGRESRSGVACSATMSREGR